jgi:hypothetical protein
VAPLLAKGEDRAKVVGVTGSQLVAAVAVILTVHCARGAATSEKRTLFHADGAHEAELGTIRDFLMRLHKAMRCSKECFILALVYMDRLVECCDRITISNLTVHRLLLAGTLVASKVMDDNGFDNAHYAKVGGLTTKEMNVLEEDLLQHLSWRVYVQPAEFEWYNNLVCRAISGK